MFLESQKVSESATSVNGACSDKSGETYDAWKKRILQEANVEKS